MKPRQIFAFIFSPLLQASATQAKPKESELSRLLKLSDDEIVDNLFKLPKPQILYLTYFTNERDDREVSLEELKLPDQAFIGHISRLANEYPNTLHGRIRSKVINTLLAGLGLGTTTQASKEDFEKAIELTTILSNAALIEDLVIDTYKVDQFTVGFDSHRQAIYSKVDELDQTSNDRDLVFKLKEMVSKMREASSAVIA